MIFGIGIAIWAIFKFGWLGGIYVVGTSMVSSLIYTILSTFAFGGDKFLLWMIGTIAVWPIGLWIVSLMISLA
jgi:hypothetical protein